METDEYEYLLVKPYTLIKVFKKPILRDGECSVRPVIAGICKSDLLYFKGDKDSKKIYQNLPIVPLHEGIVRIVENGKLGVIIPFKKCNKCYACLNDMENLCENNQYMGSNISGLARSVFSYPKELIIDVPQNVPSNIAAILEPMTIVYRMVLETNIDKNDRIAVIGTGLLGSLTIIFLSKLKHVNKNSLHLIGRSDDKLTKMKDLCEVINISNPAISNLKNYFSVIVEAVGGHSMSSTLDLAIKLSRPRGRINIFGLSDNVSNINFTNIINKGLILTGFSRSKISDYISLMELINRNSDLIPVLERVVDKKQFFIRNEADLIEAFHYALSGNNYGRVIVCFEEDKIK